MGGCPHCKETFVLRMKPGRTVWNRCGKCDRSFNVVMASDGTVFVGREPHTPVARTSLIGNARWVSPDSPTADIKAAEEAQERRAAEKYQRVHDFELKQELARRAANEGLLQAYDEG